MPSALALSKLMTELKLQMFDHDPGATTAIVTSPDGGTTKRVVDFASYTHLLVAAKPSIVAAGGLTLLEIIAADDSAMSANVTVVKTTTIAADSLNDYVVLECSAEEVAQLSAAGGFALRYVAARLTMATNTDEAVVVYLALPRFHYDGQTATLIN